MRPRDPDQAIEQIAREEWGRILAALTATLGQLQLAEDCLQDAVLSAMEDWHRNGLPASPAAWLMTLSCQNITAKLRGFVGPPALHRLALSTMCTVPAPALLQPLRLPLKARSNPVPTCPDGPPLKFPAGAVKLSKSSLKICALAEAQSATQNPVRRRDFAVNGVGEFMRQAVQRLDCKSSLPGWELGLAVQVLDGKTDVGDQLGLAPPAQA